MQRRPTKQTSILFHIISPDIIRLDSIDSLWDVRGTRILLGHRVRLFQALIVFLYITNHLPHAVNKVLKSMERPLQDIPKLV